jgi:hypothetical protein
VSELEAIVGPIAMSFRSEDHENMGFLSRPRSGRGDFTKLVPRLSVTYAWDVYHEDPTRPRDVELLELALDVRGDAAEAEQILRAHFGAPRTVRDGDTTYDAFHPFYVARLAATPDRFRLAWFAEVPRFAIPAPDAGVRERWLRGLRDRLATAKSIDEVAAYCASVPAGAGVKITGALDIELVPPAPASLVVDVFAWAPAIGVSHDVHMASWHVERRDDKWLPIAGAKSQWQIDARLGGWPGGAEVHGRRGAYALGDRDEITVLSIEPRLK